MYGVSMHFSVSYFDAFFKVYLEIPVNSPKKTMGSPFYPTPLLLNRLQRSRKVAETGSGNGVPLNRD